MHMYVRFVALEWTQVQMEDEYKEKHDLLNKQKQKCCWGTKIQKAPGHTRETRQQGKSL